MLTLNKLENSFRMQQRMYAIQVQLQKQALEMTSAKFTALLFSLLGWPMMGVSILSDLDKTKATVIFIVGLLFSCVGFHYKRKAWIANLDSKRLDNQLKVLKIKEVEMDQKEKQLDFDERVHDMKQSEESGEKRKKKK